MPQYARPDLDTTLGNFQDEGGGTTTIYDGIDETSASDADYIRSPTSPASEVYVCRLSDVVDQSAQESLDFTCQLRMTYVNEGSPGTLIATMSRTGVTSTTWTDTSYTLSGGEADAITDYTALFLRFVINKP